MQIRVWKKKKHFRGFSEYHYHSVSDKNVMEIGDAAKDVFNSIQKRQLTVDEVLSFAVWQFKNGNWNCNFMKGDEFDKTLDLDTEDLASLFMHFRELNEQKQLE